MKLTHQQNQSDAFIKNYENSALFIGNKKYNYNIILSEKNISKWDIQNTSDGYTIKNIYAKNNSVDNIIYLIISSSLICKKKCHHSS